MQIPMEEFLKARVERVDRSMCGTPHPKQFVAEGSHRTHGTPMRVPQADPTLWFSSATNWMRGCLCAETSFVILGNAAAVNNLYELLKTKFSVKLATRVDGDREQEAEVMNRVVA